jgi:autotransporter-associated beta strand protein
MLQLGQGGTTGWVQGDIVNNDRLAFQRSDSLHFSNAISGLGMVIQSGAGVLDLSGPMSYEGGTIIETGTLLFNSHLPYHEWSIVMVGHPLGTPGDAVLGGNGRIDREVQVFGSGVIAPGNSVGTLEVGGDVIFGAGAALRIEIKGDGEGACDLLAVDGALHIGQATIVFHEISPLTHSAYVFASYGALMGDEFAKSIGLPDGYWIDYDYQGLNQIALVPEPAAGALAAGIGALAAVLAAACRRRARRGSQHNPY